VRPFSSAISRRIWFHSAKGGKLGVTRLRMSGPQLRNSGTFSIIMIGGRIVSAHRITHIAVARLCSFTGRPPRAVLKCVHSGEAINTSSSSSL
jgi:hypothetical protein